MSIVDEGRKPDLDVQIVVPMGDMTRPEETAAVTLPVSDVGEGESLLYEAPTGNVERGVWPVIYPKLLELIYSHRSTIIFVNSRGLCERLTQRLNDLAGEDLCRSHHGSVAHEERRVIEDRLKSGFLRAIVATSSLELGIDMGALDLVVLVESPGSVARGLQRIGRAGHGVGIRSIGRVFPKHRSDLLEAAVVVSRMKTGELEPVPMPENPLDILAQHVVACVANDDWSVSDLRDMVKRSANFAKLPESAFQAVLDMLSGLYPSSAFAELSPRILWDRQTDQLTGRRGSKMLAIVGGGTIPDRGTYGVFLLEGGARVGELDEEMVHETVPGQVITLGASSWHVERITRDQVLVRPAPGEIGKLPFWRGEGPGRPVSLGKALGEFVRKVSSMKEEAATTHLRETCSLDDLAIKNLLAYLAEQKETSGTVPTDKSISIERFRDELGDWRICILSPFGARVHAPWAMAIESKLSASSGFEVQTMWSDDGIALRFADVDELPPISELVPSSEEVEDLIVNQVGSSALFASQFRENASRSLVMPRRRPGKRVPLWVQRLKSQELLAVARQFSTFPVVMETYRSCLKDVFDMPALVDILSSIESKQIKIVEVETQGPSPFARSLAFAYVAAYLYEGDSPLAERRAQALSLDKNMLRELLGQEELRELLDADVILALGEELQCVLPERRAKTVDHLHDLLRRMGDLTEEEIKKRCDGDHASWIEALLEQRRILRLRVGGEDRIIAVEDAGLYRDALGCLPPPLVPDAFLRDVPNAAQALVARWAKNRTPFVAGELASRYQLPSQYAQNVLALLEESGKLVSGAFRPGGKEKEWCNSDILRRIKRRTLAKLRDEVAPVEPAALGRFLPDWHGVDTGEAGMSRLKQVIVQLEGLPLSVAELESVILPSRVADFSPGMLDELGASGWLTWIGCGSLGARDGRVALYRRETAALLHQLPAEPVELSETAQAMLAHLENRGASFFVQLREAAGGVRLEDAVLALRELVWAGVVTNDTFQPLRSKGALRGGSSRGRARALLATVGGRWSHTGEILGEVDHTKAAHTRATKLLERHGIVSREVQKIESSSGGFSATYTVLREMEELGKVRRGYFVEGGGGAQFALPGAVDRLRRARETDARTVIIAATDPANPFGWILPWPESQGDGSPKRMTGSYVAMHGGEAVFYIRAGSKQVITFSQAEDIAVSESCLRETCRLFRRMRKRYLRVDKVNGERASKSAFADALARAEFTLSPGGFERELR